MLDFSNFYVLLKSMKNYPINIRIVEVTGSNPVCSTQPGNLDL